MIQLLDGYKYECPISLLTKQIQNEYNEHLENSCMAIIKETIGIDIDKNELIKALNYDRNQYEKGFKDGFIDGLNRNNHQNHGHWIPNNDILICSECKITISKTLSYYYCPCCGAKMNERTYEE